MKRRTSEESVAGAPASLQRRGERLARDYVDTERVLRQQGIRQTIVVFGSTRIQESGTTPRGSGPDYYGIAREFGAIVGRSGAGPDDCRLTLVTGAGPGIMEAANRGASDVGAKSIGLSIDLPHEQVPNPYVTKELSFEFRYFAIRKLHFMLRAKALVVFPGGFGTLDELFETLNLVRTRKMRPLPVILVGREFWQRVCDLQMLAERGMVDFGDLEIVRYAETAEQAWQSIVRWHRAAGSPLMCDTEAGES